MEETAVRITPGYMGHLAGLDVHGIPAHKGEPFHLHYDLIFAFGGESGEITSTAEAPQVAWCGTDDMDRYGLPASIVCAFQRVAVR
jgi:hypothetical protein